MSNEQLNQLRSIWNNPGRRPAYHEYQKSRLKKEWPLLYKWIVTQLERPSK